MITVMNHTLHPQLLTMTNAQDYMTQWKKISSIQHKNEIKTENQSNRKYYFEYLSLWLICILARFVLVRIKNADLIASRHF